MSTLGNDVTPGNDVTDNDKGSFWPPVDVKKLIDNIDNKTDPIAGAWGPYNSNRAGNPHTKAHEFGNSPNQFDINSDRDNDEDDKGRYDKHNKGPRSIPFKDLSKP